MYTSFFGLKENPFNLTPDLKYLFLSRYHEEALEHLLYGINERKGFIVITGGIGTGKTTLCRALLHQLDASTKSALIFNSFISDMELLENINHEFGIRSDSQKKSKKDLIDALNFFLLENFSSGGNAVLLIDEAQNLSHSVLEQVRMLSNLETEKEKLIQIILIGQPELKEQLATPSLKQLDERVTVRYDLQPLDQKDIGGYIEHRLVVGGSRGNLSFSSGALKKIYAYAQGNPRRINAVCDRSLLIAYVGERHLISKKMVAKAIDDFHRNLSVDPLMADWSRKRLYFAGFALVLLVLITGFAGWSYKKDVFGLYTKEQLINSTVPAVVSPMPLKERKALPSLYFDEKTSVATLFNLFQGKGGITDPGSTGQHIGIATFTIEPEYFVMLKRPFRIQIPSTIGTSRASSQYLIVLKQIEGGAVVLDSENGEQEISRETVLTHWGSKVSWVYPLISGDVNFVKGMRHPDVLRIQTILSTNGYLVELTGVYDDATIREVVKFQNDFGLMGNGRIGSQTRALLYQVEGTGKYYIVKKKDTLSKIAGRREVFNNSLKWPLLFRLNMEALKHLEGLNNPEYKELPEGTRLRIGGTQEMMSKLNQWGNKAWIINALSAHTSDMISPHTITLMKSGYHVYLMEARVKGHEWLRLRVGFFENKSEAKKEGKRIMGLLNTKEMWVTRISEKEIAEFRGT